MARVECNASDKVIQYVSFVRPGDDEGSCRAAAMDLVAAASALCGEWITPLAVTMRVESRNPEDYYFADEEHPPTHPAWLLRLHEWDERLSLHPDWIDPQERRVDAIGAAELLAFTEEAVDQRPPIQPREIALPELMVNALALALPEGIEIDPRYRGMPVNPVLERDGQRMLVLGPKVGIGGGMPALLSASNRNGTSHLQLELCWDFWKAHPAGRAQLREAVERMLSHGRGWQLECYER